MRTRDDWRAYIRARAELHCRLLKLIREDEQLACLQPPGLATLVGALCATLTHRATSSDSSQNEIELGIETVLWNRIQSERKAA